MAGELNRIQSCGICCKIGLINWRTKIGGRSNQARKRACILTLEPDLLFLQALLQVDDVGANAFEAGIDFQGVAEIIERGLMLTQLQEALAEAGGGAEMEGVEFQSFAAVGQRFGKTTQGEIGDGALIPGFGQPGAFVDELGGSGPSRRRVFRRSSAR